MNSTRQASIAPSAKLIAEGAGIVELSSDPDGKSLRSIRKSIQVTKALRHALRDSEAELKRFSTPFLEASTEPAPQKRVDARRQRQRDAVYSIAKSVLDPNNKLNRSLDRLTPDLEILDPRIALNLGTLKSTVLEPLANLAQKALNDANQQKLDELAKDAPAAFQELNEAITQRQTELNDLFKALRSELWALPARYLRPTRHKVIAASAGALIALAAIGSYFAVTRNRDAQPAKHSASKAQAVDAPGIARAVPPKPAQPKAEPKPAESTHPAARDTTLPYQPSAAPIAREPAKHVDVNAVTVYQSGDPESIRRTAQSIGDVIRAWNAESDKVDAAAKRPRR